MPLEFCLLSLFCKWSKDNNDDRTVPSSGSLCEFLSFVSFFLSVSFFSATLRFQPFCCLVSFSICCYLIVHCLIFSLVLTYGPSHPHFLLLVMSIIVFSLIFSIILYSALVLWLSFSEYIAFGFSAFPLQSALTEHFCLLNWPVWHHFPPSDVLVSYPSNTGSAVWRLGIRIADLLPASKESWPQTPPLRVQVTSFSEHFHRF